VDGRTMHVRPSQSSQFEQLRHVQQALCWQTDSQTESMRILCWKLHHST